MNEIVYDEGDHFCVPAKEAGESSTQIHQTWQAQHKEQASLIYPLDTGISGLLILAKTADAKRELRNAYGSNLFTFEFVLWAYVENELSEQWDCDLSIAWDAYKHQAFPSKLKGKKACTQFKVEQRYNHYYRIRATVHYLRPQQIQLHAHYGHLEVLGDTRFSQKDHSVYLSYLKPGFKKSSDEKPLSSGLHIHLQHICFDFRGQHYNFSHPCPKDWVVLEKYFTRYLQ
ncbi:MAG: hypothetical protein LBH52_00145 [Puniceicoccales bacterium]|jgi:23S rRNA-/tRNA-specific pseudouridylate synthase|nr:hypothetical protein [Puniceicoccales bacterium]